MGKRTQLVNEGITGISKIMSYFILLLVTKWKHLEYLSPEPCLSSTPHRCTHENHLILFFFNSETFSVSLRPCNVSCLSVPSRGHCPMTPDPANFHPQGSGFVHSLCLPTVPDFCSQFCSLCPQLQLVPGTIPSFRN